jgi:hypothetical protein
MRSTDHGNHSSRATVIQIAAPPLDDWAVGRLAISARSLAAISVERRLRRQAYPRAFRSDERWAVDQS